MWQRTYNRGFIYLFVQGVVFWPFTPGWKFDILKNVSTMYFGNVGNLSKTRGEREFSFNFYFIHSISPTGHGCNGLNFWLRFIN